MAAHIELAIAIMAAVAGGAWAILQMVTRHFDQRQDDLKQMIAQQFDMAEQARKEATMHWRSVFEELRGDNLDIEQRLDNLNTRVSIIEADLRHIEQEIKDQRDHTAF